MPDVGPLATASLTDLIRRIFLASGLTAEEADLVSPHVVDAEARESRSQGLVRVPAYVA